MLGDDLAGLDAQLDVGDHRHLAVRERAERETATLTDVARLLDRVRHLRLPVRDRLDGGQDRLPARAHGQRVVDVLLTERRRVHARRKRELVDDLLTGEVRLRRARGAQSGTLERAVVERLCLREHALVLRGDRVDRVGRIRAAVAGHCPPGRTRSSRVP